MTDPQIHRAYTTARLFRLQQTLLSSCRITHVSDKLSLFISIYSQASDVDQFLDDLFMPVLDGNQAGDDGLSDARSLAASMRGGGDDSGILGQGTVAPEDKRIVSFSRSGSALRESILRQGMADLRPEFGIDGDLDLAEVIRGGGRDSPTNSEQNKPNVGFQPIPGMISPTGMISPPPPMLMPTPVQGNPQQLMLQLPQGGGAAGAGGGAEQQPAMAFTYVPVPVYNMSGVSLPGIAPQSGTVSPIKTTAAEDKSDGAKKQPEDPSDQVQQQQMYQQAFLQNAVAQNMQVVILSPYIQLYNPRLVECIRTTLQILTPAPSTLKSKSNLHALIHTDSTATPDAKPGSDSTPDSAVWAQLGLFRCTNAVHDGACRSSSSRRLCRVGVDVLLAGPVPAGVVLAGEGVSRRGFGGGGDEEAGRPGMGFLRHVSQNYQYLMYL